MNESVWLESKRFFSPYESGNRGVFCDSGNEGRRVVPPKKDTVCGTSHNGELILQ